MQMNNRRKRSGTIRLRQKRIDDARRRLDERLAAFKREAALQRANLVARAFELHAFGGYALWHIARVIISAEAS